jgi:hypothetical protein
MTQLVSMSGATPTPWPKRLWVADDARPGQKRLLTGDAITEAVIIAAGGALADAAPAPVGGIPARWYNGAWRSAPSYTAATHHAPVWSGTAWADPVQKTVAVRKVEMKAAARARYGEIADGGTTATISEGVTIPVATSTAPALRLMRGKEHMTAADIASMPVVTSAGTPVTLTPAIAGVMLAAIDGHVAACEACQNALVTAINAAETHAALDLVDVQAGTVDGTGGWP